MEELYSSDYLSTTEAAATLMVKPGTIRVALCTKGHYFGMVPVQLPNRRLLWRREEVIALLTGNREMVDES